MMVRHFAAVLALACSACGIKGPLYLPPKPQPAAVAPATSPPAATPDPSSPPPPPGASPEEKKP